MGEQMCACPSQTRLLQSSLPKLNLATEVREWCLFERTPKRRFIEPQTLLDRRVLRHGRGAVMEDTGANRIRSLRSFPK